MSPLRGLFGDRVDLKVTTDRPEYLPGEAVQTTVSIAGRQELEIDEARVELVSENEYTHTERSYSGRNTSSTHDVTDTDRVVHATEPILEARTIRPGEQLERTVSLAVPPGASPSGEGEITSVRWKVAVVLSRRHALDPDEQAPIRVVSSPEAYAERAETPPELDAPGDWQLEFRLPGDRTARTGERVSGALVLTPSEESEPQEIRVELVRREEVPRGQGNASETVEAEAQLAETPSLGARIPRELAFDLAVPATACPTLRTDESTVRWYLRGVVARRLRSDYNLLEELNVHSGPAS